LESAQVLVNNHNFPHFFTKKPAQRYLQTWHGTPLKQIGLDAPQHSISPGYRRLIGHESKQWDLLLAQNDFAAETFSASFAYDGPIACVGYPRNDSLVNTLPQRREDLRSMFGIRRDQHAVLYAPTWRDDARTLSGGNSMVSHVDFASAWRMLGDSVIFLVRGHHNVVDDRKLESTPNVFDVSDYPEINDLFAASDSLVTDYSSCMFDYCVTGKPIRLLVPDYEEYEQKRGFYMNILSIAPGPVFRDSAALLKSFILIPQDFPDTADNYSNFLSRFALRDDGNSSKKVLELAREKGWI
jgi:CDP-glycerol glycerophosphotransferase